MIEIIRRNFRSFSGAIVFYTILPIPWSVNFNRIARWIPLIGVLIGVCLSFFDFLLGSLSMPFLPRSALVVGVWIYITGGLHLDGVGDTGDGLGVTNPERRLEVMADSVTGAFGVMAIVLVIILKIAALSEIERFRPLVLISACIWGRWGQVMAIALYPYLKPTGKGALHKTDFRFPLDCWGGVLGIVGIGTGIISIIAGGTIALLTGYWFARRLGGHTGDSYGAVVEWTEALFLCAMTCII